MMTRTGGMLAYLTDRIPFNKTGGWHMTTVVEEPQTDVQPEEDQPKKITAVAYSFFKLDPTWRRLPDGERAKGRAEAAEILRGGARIRNHIYSTVGLKASTDLMMWSVTDSLQPVQDQTAALLSTGLGRYLELSRVMFGITRQAEYVRRRDTQEQGIFEEDRGTYLMVYPFTKDHSWYQLGKDARQGFMNEHIRIAKPHRKVRQLLVYSYGLDDQEHIVAYETEDLHDFQTLVMELRESDGRPYTLNDMPIYTGIHHSVDRALELLG